MVNMKHTIIVANADRGACLKIIGIKILVIILSFEAVCSSYKLEINKAYKYKEKLVIYPFTCLK